MIGKIKTFAAEVVKEMKKVSWPSREQLKESTVVVVATSLVITLYVFLIDQVVAKVVDVIFS